MKLIEGNIYIYKEEGSPNYGEKAKLVSVSKNDNKWSDVEFLEEKKKNKFYYFTCVFTKSLFPYNENKQLELF